LTRGLDTSSVAILSQQSTLADDTKQQLIATAQQKDFVTNELILVEQKAAGVKEGMR